jgi:hypothetical protein
MGIKRYPEEFKIKAVKQVPDRGHAVAGSVNSGSSYRLLANILERHSARGVRNDC